MGADLILHGVVLTDGVAPDWEAARKYVRELGEADLGDWFDDVDQMRSQLLADVDAVGGAIENGSRELDWFQAGRYRLYLTGGMSWGDSPTELYDSMRRLEEYGVDDVIGFGVKVSRTPRPCGGGASVQVKGGRMSDRQFQPGDVVCAEGASAILGDVVEVDYGDGDQLVTVAWRSTVTVEDHDDLELAQRAPSEEVQA